MDKKKLKRTIGEIGRDVTVAFVIVAVVMLSLYAYCGIWPPMVVIESGSMEHPPDMWTKKSYIGVIDTGDMVFVKQINASYGKGVTTYVQGEATGHWRYGSYGDVVIYRPNGLKFMGDGTPVVPIIHRLVVWLELNTTHVNPNFNGVDYANYSFDVPSLNIYDSTDSFTIYDYGYRNENVTINLDRNAGLMRYYESMGLVPHGGYITMGDNNCPSYDQPLSGAYEPVLPEWIIGKAWGELPWFGLIKLRFTGTDTSGVASNSWNGLYVTIACMLLVPLALDFIIPIIKSRKGGNEEEEEAEEFQPEAEGEKQEPPPETQEQDNAENKETKHDEHMPNDITQEEPEKDAE